MLTLEWNETSDQSPEWNKSNIGAPKPSDPFQAMMIPASSAVHALPTPQQYGLDSPKPTRTLKAVYEDTISFSFDLCYLYKYLLWLVPLSLSGCSLYSIYLLLGISDCT
jgi:hypothetical protein